MTEPATIWFLRSGRKRRGVGASLDTDPTTGCIKVDANWPYTQPVWVTPEEIAAAGETRTRTKAIPEEPAPPTATGQIAQALVALERIDTIRLAVAGFADAATAISQARVALDGALKTEQNTEQNDQAMPSRP